MSVTVILDGCGREIENLPKPDESNWPPQEEADLHTARTSPCPDESGET